MVSQPVADFESAINDSEKSILRKSWFEIKIFIFFSFFIFEISNSNFQVRICTYK